MRGIWTHATIGWIVAAALLPPTAVLLLTGGAARAATLAAALIAALAWQGLFRQAAGVPFSPSGAVTAVAIAALGPEGLAPWQAALGASFGIVLADLVFGGWGRNVVAAPAAALAFLFLSFPALAPPAPAAAMALAAAASGAILLVLGVISGRVVLAALAGAAAVPVVAGTPAVALAGAGALAFGVVFLVADPVAAAAMPAGRWLYGGLAGLLAGLFAALGPGPEAPQPIVFAALLAQVFAPLLDRFALFAEPARRSRPDG
jgi:Na+-transporting NADH:ubiquinone oxidoreductase subunit B